MHSFITIQNIFFKQNILIDKKQIGGFVNKKDVWVITSTKYNYTDSLSTNNIKIVHMSY